ncbi:MAG: MFS transporter [Streptosporangiaceae bacterium]
MTNILTRDTRVRALAGRERPVRPGLILAVVLIGQFMAVLDASIVNVAAPSIHAHLGASGAGLQLVVAGYTITYAVLLVTGARLGDILGHRRVFLAGLVLFTLASLGCGLAGSAGLLIALRLIQGAGAAVMIPQVLSLIQRTHAGPARAGAMSLYSAVIAGGAVVGQLAGGLLISANLFGSDWRPVFLVNVPVGVALLAVGARALPPGQGEPGRTLDLPGLALLTPAVLAFVLPLVLGQPEHWPAWGWIMMAASVPLAAAFVAAERRTARNGGTPLIPGRVLRVPGVPVAIAALFVVMTVFSGFFFTLALHLQDGLGYSPLHAGLAFAPAAATFALVSLNWRRLPARWHGAVIVTGFVLFAAAMAALGSVVRDGGTGATGICLLGALSGAGMAAAFSPLMTRVLLRVPVELAADATGVVVTVNQLGLLVGVATFGTLYLNLAGRLPVAGPGTPPSPSALAAFRHTSAHAEAITFAALAALAAVGIALAITHLIERRHPA